MSVLITNIGELVTNSAAALHDAALVTAVCELARDQGGSHMVLWVTDVNARARAFYARMGFTPTGERAQVRPAEPDHWEGRMIRALDPD